MEELDVRTHAEAVCTALVAGDVERVIEELSPELRHNLGEVIALLPLPASEATVASIERGGGSGYTVVLRVVGETETIELQTRWKDRAGSPTIVEASHLSRTESAARTDDADNESAPAGDEPG